MMNKVILIGRTTADPEVKYTQSGVALASFRLAVDRGFKNQQGERETDFIPVTCWRRQAEVVGEYLKKGRLVAVEGRLQSRNYETRDGQKRTAYDVVADFVQFLESRGSSGGGDSGGGRSPRGGSRGDSEETEVVPDEGPGPDEPEGDDLPF
jgi:single-strand DNA-binding protein